MKTIKIPSELKKFGSIFAQNGFESYLVGGAVRDMIMKKSVSDWDIATNASPEQVSKMFKKVIPTGIEHGTVTVIFMNHHIEVTTFRTDADYSDGRHPDKISYAATIEEDLSRRDFTMNAIAANLITGEIKDPFCGQIDIKNKIIRTVGKATERFSEDGLRPVRALRFASQLNFAIEEETFAAIPKCIDVTKKIAVERFHDELLKMLKSQTPSIGLFLMEKTGVLELFIPELAKCRGVEQKGFHCFDVLDHLFYSTDGAPKEKQLVRLAALFHDIGKPSVRGINEKTGVYTFYQHENASSKIAEKILNRLHFSKADTVYICHLIKQHMFFYEDSWTDSAVRRFLVRIKHTEYENILEDLFDLRRADLYGMNKMPAPINHLINFQDRIEKILQEQSALSLKDLAVNGKDLIQSGIEPGKKLGLILNELLETVLEDPKMNEKEKLITVAKNIYKTF